ncbi:MAG: hypothetical protein IKW83_09100 [Muribaculaceae bacterium]|nr:hypothetical protein [Muribaculaceae bacterium]
MTSFRRSVWSLVVAIVVGSILPIAADSIAVDYSMGLTINISGKDFAPYHIASNRRGTVTQQHSALISASLRHEMDTTQRLSWGAGIEAWGGYASGVDYLRYDPAADVMIANNQHPARVWMQQLWVEGKYRGAFITLGQKDIDPGFMNHSLGSGDLVMSGNARAPYGVRVGFINYQNIPFTHGWVQIKGEIGYYRHGDSKWLENHYNYYNNFITTNYWFNYKNTYFRTNPSKPLVFTIGMQAACQFGGTATYYNNGMVWQEIKMKANAESFWHAFIPGSGGENMGDKIYVEGNHVGSWDMALEYKLSPGQTLRGYYQSPWEDGSGVGKLNGYDGLWGVEYRSDSHGVVTGVVAEFLTLMNQSGPIHFAYKDFTDDDHPNGSDIGNAATGSDDYYNNYCYNGYHNRGMSIGSPMAKSPIYNTDGYLRFTDNRLRGFHLGLMGDIGNQVTYRALFSWRKSFGTPFIPHRKPITGTSMMLEATYTPHWLSGLEIKVQFAHDHGTLYGNNTGALISIFYNGNFSF